MEDVLTRLAETVSDADDLETLTRPLLELLEAVTGLESTYLTAIDTDAGQQHILYARNAGAMNIPEGLTVPWADTLCKRALDENRPYTDNVPGVWPDSDAALKLGIRTYVSQPVYLIDGQLYGTLCAASSEAVSIAPHTLKVLDMFGRLIGFQIERERELRSVRRANAELSSIALIDPLTGVGNRRAMRLALERMLDRARHGEEPLDVAYIDLDGFKGINDRYGHAVGDRFLHHIVSKLVAATRPVDFVARVGGDEFVVLASAAGEAFGERLTRATQGLYRDQDCEFDYPGASVGVVRALPGESGVDELLRRADKAMYAVKQARKAGGKSESR